MSQNCTTVLETTLPLENAEAYIARAIANIRTDEGLETSIPKSEPAPSTARYGANTPYRVAGDSARDERHDHNLAL
jgi:hypothetical protein